MIVSVGRVSVEMCAGGPLRWEGEDASGSQRAGGKIGFWENNKSIPKSLRGERDHVAGGRIETAAQRHRGNESVGERRRKKLKCRRSWEELLDRLEIRDERHLGCRYERAEAAAAAAVATSSSSGSSD